MLSTFALAIGQQIAPPKSGSETTFLSRLALNPQREIERNPKVMNTNETVNLEIELMIEEVETIVAPGPMLQHNETVEVELAVEEAETVIAPGISLQHNETVEIELSV